MAQATFAVVLDGETVAASPNPDRAMAIRDRVKSGAGVYWAMNYGDSREIIYCES